jgi:hypothetical protein
MGAGDRPPPAPRPGEPEPTGSTPDREPTARPAERLANNDAVVEQLAHGMVDHDLTPADEAFLQANGYRTEPPIRGEHEFVMRVFYPTEEGKPPIVAFRGTVPSKPATIVADLDPRGIGMWQYNANRTAIEHAVNKASEYGPVVFAGHSLGGALAQTAASRFPGQADRIVTFQAPGVSRGTVRSVEDFNAAHPDHPVLSDHHRVTGDLVPRGGRALTPGTVYDHEMFGGSRLSRNPLSKHTSLPLAQEEVAAGHQVPISHDGQQFRPTGEHSTAEDNAGKSQVLENVRTGVGGVVYGPGLAVSSVRRLFGPPGERASLPAGEPMHELPPGETTPHDPLPPPAPRPGDETGLPPPAPRPGDETALPPPAPPRPAGESEPTPRSTSSAHDEITPNTEERDGNEVVATGPHTAEPPTVQGFRAQGRPLIALDQAGNVAILRPQGRRRQGVAVHVGFDGQRARMWIQEMERGEVIEFTVRREFLEHLRETAQPEHGVVRDRTRPWRVDVDYPDQYAIPPALLDALEAAIVPGSGRRHTDPSTLERP